MDRITLAGMRFECHLGVSAEEQAMPQLVEIDLEIEADLAAASRSDRLADTVDYGPLIELAERLTSTRRFDLIEGLAGQLAAGALEASPSISAVVVRVRKLAVPVPVDMDHAQVELRRDRG